MADLAQLEEQIVSLSLLEAAALVKKLEERLGVSAAAAAPVAVAAGGGSSGSCGRGEDRIPGHSQGLSAQTRSTPSRLFARLPRSA